MAFAYSEAPAFFVQVADAHSSPGVQLTVETTSCVGADVHKYLPRNLVVPNPLPCCPT